MERIHIVKKSVTKLDVDCVVNAANEGLWAGGGVCGAIFKEAGYNELTDACTKIGHCDTGNAVITPGFQLKAKYIIHAVGPQWHGGSHNKEHLLRKCYQTALLLARDNGCKSIGFPLISSGIYGYPKKEAWQVALRAVADSLDSFVDMDDVIDMQEGFLKRLFKELMNVEIKTPLPRLTWKEAMERYVRLYR